MLLTDISYLSFSLLRFAVPRLLVVEYPWVSNYRSNYPISGHRASSQLCMVTSLRDGHSSSNSLTIPTASEKQMEHFCLELRH